MHTLNDGDKCGFASFLALDMPHYHPNDFLMNSKMLTVWLPPLILKNHYLKLLKPRISL